MLKRYIIVLCSCYWVGTWSILIFEWLISYETLAQNCKEPWKTPIITIFYTKFNLSEIPRTGLSLICLRILYQIQSTSAVHVKLDSSGFGIRWTFSVSVDLSQDQRNPWILNPTLSRISNHRQLWIDFCACSTRIILQKIFHPWTNLSANIVLPNYSKQLIHVKTAFYFSR